MQRFLHFISYLFLVFIVFAIVSCNRAPQSQVYKLKVGKVPVGYGHAFSSTLSTNETPFVVFLDASASDPVLRFCSISKKGTLISQNEFAVGEEPPCGSLAFDCINTETQGVSALVGLKDLYLARGLGVCEKQSKLMFIRECPGVRFPSALLLNSSWGIVLVRDKGNMKLDLVNFDEPRLSENLNCETYLFDAFLHGRHTRLATALISDKFSTIDFFQFDQNIKPFKKNKIWESLGLPERIYQIHVVRSSQAPTVIIISGFSIYCAVFTDGTWQLTKITQQSSRISGATSVTDFDGYVYIFYQPVGTEPRLICGQSLYNNWSEAKLGKLFPPIIFQSELLATPKDFLYILTTEGTDGDVFLQDLFLRKLNTQYLNWSNVTDQVKSD